MTSLERFMFYLHQIDFTFKVETVTQIFQTINNFKLIVLRTTDFDLKGNKPLKDIIISSHDRWQISVKLKEKKHIESLFHMNNHLVQHLRELLEVKSANDI